MGETWILLAMRYDFHPTAQIAALDFLANIAKEYFSQDFFIALCDKIIIHPQKDTLLNTVACVIGDNMEKITEESMCHCVVQLLQFIDM